MKKIQFLLLFCGYFILTGLFMNAQKQADINYTSTPPAIDGVADDAVWAGTNDNVNDVPNDIEPTNSSGSWKAIWDMDNIYILVDVTDDILWDNNGAPAWNTDNLEIYFQMDNERTGEGPSKSHGTQYSFKWGSSTTDISGEGSNENVEFVRVDKGTATLGYVIEVKIPWESLRTGYAVANDNAIAFDVNIVDNDGSGYSTLYWNSDAGLWGNIDNAGTIILKGEPLKGQFSDIEYYGEAGNFTELNPSVWAIQEIPAGSSDMRYAMTIGNSAGGSLNRKTIVNEKTFSDGFFVETDVKLYKRDQTWVAADAPFYEDAGIYLNYIDGSNYVKAAFFNHPEESGFKFYAEGAEYKFLKDDADADPVEETPAESAIPYVDDNSFNDWNTIRVEKTGTIIAMLVNGAEYFAIDIDTIADADAKAAIESLVSGSGQIGIGSDNDQVAFDNVDAGYLSVTGQFSDLEYYGEAGNFTELNPSVWAIEEIPAGSGDMRYAMTIGNSAGGALNRKTIVNEKTFSDGFFVETDVKLYKRDQTWVAADAPFYEDAGIYINYIDGSNYVKAAFFNHPEESGFKFYAEGAEYKFLKDDADADPVEETPAESAIPYVDDNSFNDWNAIRVEKTGTVLTMFVNGEEYFAIDIDTITDATAKAAITALVSGTGQIGIGSDNDQVAFDNVNAGYLSVKGQFSDIEYYGEAGNFTELNPSVWAIQEIPAGSGDMRYAMQIGNSAGGSLNRKTIVNEKTFSDGFFVETDVKLYKRDQAWVAADAPFYEDAGIYINYIDGSNYVKAAFFNHPEESGFKFYAEGAEYKFLKDDADADPVEETPAESAIPYVDDNSFNDWNAIRVEKTGTVLTMFVNGEEYFAIDIDTITDATAKAAITALISGIGQIGIGSDNDQVAFDNVDAGYLSVKGQFSDIEYYGEAGNFTELNPSVWAIQEIPAGSGDMRYAMQIGNSAGGSLNRKTIVNEKTFSDGFFVETDVKLYKRDQAWVAADAPFYEDAGIYINYIDGSNYVKAAFFNHPEESGFKFYAEGAEYKFLKDDADADPVEETPAESAIPYVDDNSFNDWNTIRVEKTGTILTMFVNEAEYFAIDIDTITDAAAKAAIESLVSGSGQIGIGSDNDQVAFDNVNAGYLSVKGQFSDIEYYGEAGNFTELNPSVWAIEEIPAGSGDMRYAMQIGNSAGGSLNRKTIVNEKTFSDEFFVETDVKLYKRDQSWVAADAPFYEDAGIYLNYIDGSNYVKAAFFNHPEESGFKFYAEGTEYKFLKDDADADPVEETPAESAIPYVDDNSFNDWNTIRVEKSGTIITMLVNGTEYFAIDIDTITDAAAKAAIESLVSGSGQIGIGSDNDQVAFDNVLAGSLSGVEPSVLTVSDITFDGATIAGFVAGELAAEYSIDAGETDVAGIESKINVVPTSSTSNFEIISVNDNKEGLVVIEFKVVGEDNSEAQSKINISYTVGISESSLSTLKVYPNPVANSINISNSIKIMKVEIINIYGSLVEVVENSNSSSLKIDTNDLEAGIYLLNIQSIKGDNAVLRIVKK